MGRHLGKLLSFAGAVLWLSVALLTLGNVYYRYDATSHAGSFLRPHNGDSNEDTVPQHKSFQFSAEQIEEDRNGLRTFLFPQEHSHREATTIRLRWNITLEERAPDGVRKPVYLINGQFPGPTIEARSGDKLEIEVVNSADNDEGISIHWHGLSLRGANEMDGVIGLTQCEIGMGQRFTYKFRIQDTESGTFWYHAHSSVHLADGLYGGIVVHKPADSSEYLKGQADDYDAEQLLLISDWYHRKAKSVLDWYEDTQHFAFDPAPDSILINGRGYFNCSMAVKAFPVNCSTVVKPALKLYGDRTRLRIINTGAMAGYNIAIPGTSVKLIEVDGGNRIADAQPAESLGVLYPGERMDVIVQRQLQIGTNHPTNTFMIALDKETLKFKNFALTPTQSFPLKWNPTSPNRAATTGIDETDTVTHFDLTNAQGFRVEGIPNTPSERAVFYSRIEVLAFHGNAPLGVVNHSSWFVESPKDLPLLARERKDWPSSITPPSVFGDIQIQRDVPWYRNSGEGKWMDLVLNNLDEKGHPFHLHGHQFYIVSTHKSPGGQYEAYNPFDTESTPPGGPLNNVNPIRKDTVYVPRMGYVVLRFLLDNDGLWMLHCHALWHHGAGMGIALQIGEPALGHTKRKASELCKK